PRGATRRRAARPLARARSRRDRALGRLRRRDPRRGGTCMGGGTGRRSRGGLARRAARAAVRTDGTRARRGARCGRRERAGAARALGGALPRTAGTATTRRDRTSGEATELVGDLTVEAVAAALPDRPLRVYPALLSTEADALAWAR